MNLLVERMEHPGNRSKNISQLNDLAKSKLVKTVKEKPKDDTALPLRPPVRVSSSNGMSRSMSKPIIAINDRPIKPIRSSSQRNLTSVFRNDLFHSNSSHSFNIKEEKEDDSSATSSDDEGIIEFPARNISRRKNENVEKEVQVYSSAFGGKFSEFEFDTQKQTSSPQRMGYVANDNQNLEPTLPKGSRKLSANSLSESPFKGNHVNSLSTTSSIGRKRRTMSNNGFPNDSNKAQTRRLVDQFLQCSKGSDFQTSDATSSDPTMLELTTSNYHRNKDLNPSSHMAEGTNLTFQNLLYQDLDQSHVNSSFFLSNENSPSSSASSFINTDERIMDLIPPGIVYQNGLDTRRTTPLSSVSHIDNNLLLSSKDNNRTHMHALRNQDSIPISMKSYKKHISTTLKGLENTMKENLQQIIFVDESELIRTVGQFDNLAIDLNDYKQQLIDLQKLIGCDYLNALRSDFNEEEETTFLYKLKQNVASSVSELEELEHKMQQYKAKLTEQRETIKKLESLVKIDNSVVQAKKNTTSVYKYRFIVIDLLIISVFIYFVTLLKNIFF